MIISCWLWIFKYEYIWERSYFVPQSGRQRGSVLYVTGLSPTSHLISTVYLILEQFSVFLIIYNLFCYDVTYMPKRPMETRLVRQEGWNNFCLSYKLKTSCKSLTCTVSSFKENTGIQLQCHDMLKPWSCVPLMTRVKPSEYEPTLLGMLDSTPAIIWTVSLLIIE